MISSLNEIGSRSGLSTSTSPAAINSNEKMFSPHAGLGRLYVKRNENAKAVAPLKRANELDPSNGEVAFNMGVAFMEIRTADAGNARNAITWLAQSNKLKETAERLQEAAQ